MSSTKQTYLENKYSKILRKEEVKMWIEVDCQELLSKIAITLNSWLNSYDSGFFPNYDSKTKRLQKIRENLDILPRELLYTVAMLGNTTLQATSIALGLKIEDNQINAAKSGAEMLAICDGLGYKIIRPINSFIDRETYKIECLLQIPTEVRIGLDRSMYLPPRLTKDIKSSAKILGDSFNKHSGYLDIDTIDKLSNVAYKLDKNIVSKLEPTPDTTDKLALDNFDKYLGQCQELFKEYADEKFYFDFAYDKRGRVYSCGYHINIQSNEYHKASLKFAKSKKLTNRGWYWLRIDLANHLGLDKEDFSYRGKFILDNIDDMLANKDKWITKASDKLLFESALLSYEESLKTGESNHIVRLDATCSGPQIMSVIARDKQALGYFNVLGNTRQDYYTIVAKELYNRTKDSTHIWGKDPDFKTIRDIIKRAIMTSYYNSKRQPQDIFGKNSKELTKYYKILSKLTKGAISLQKQINDCAEVCKTQGKDTHCFSLPDNHIAYCPITNTIKTRVELPELGKKGYMNIVANVHKIGKEDGLRSLAPNVIHAIDGWIVRTATEMLAELDIELSPIHDSFGVNANDCDELRRVYRALLARLYREDIIDKIMSDIVGYKMEVTRDSFDEEVYRQILNNVEGHYIC